MPEKVTSEDEDADNECGSSSESDLDDEYRPPIQIPTDSSDEGDDRVPPRVEPIIPECRVLPVRKRRGKKSEV